jgi:hypothetical protein
MFRKILQFIFFYDSSGFSPRFVYISIFDLFIYQRRSITCKSYKEFTVGDIVLYKRCYYKEMVSKFNVGRKNLWTKFWKAAPYRTIIRVKRNNGLDFM